MPPLQPGKTASGLATKAKTSFQKRPRIIDPAALQAARSRAEASLDRMKNSPLARSPIGQAFQQYIQNLLASGEGLEEFEQEVREKAEQAIAKNKHVITFLSDALNLFRGAGTLQQIRMDVLRPARRRQLSSAQVWERVSGIVKNPTPFPFLTWVETRLGPLTIGVALQAEGGAGIGFGGAEGLSGLRHHCACHFRQLAVAVGAVAEVEIGLQLSASQGLPKSGREVSVEVTVGGGYNATLGVTASFEPKLRRPTLEDQRLVDLGYPKGFAVSLGGGGGLDIGISLGVTESTILLGTAS